MGTLETWLNRRAGGVAPRHHPPFSQQVAISKVAVAFAKIASVVAIVAAVAVGGTCSLYRVGPDGINAWDILGFAAKVGVVADIADPGDNISRAIYIHAG